MTATATQSNRRLATAWRVALALFTGTAVFLVLLQLVRPSALASLEGALSYRLFHLGGMPRIDFFGALIAVLVVEATVMGWNRSAFAALFRFSRSARTDLLLGALHAVGWAPLLMTFFSAGSIWLIEHSAKHYLPLGYVSAIGPVWLQFLVVLIVTDFFDYWTHRISHDIDFLWESHRYHHSATELTVLTGTREHAMNEAFRHFVVAIPLAALGVLVKQYIAVRLVLYVVDLLQHSMLPWTYGWVGRWLVYSPVGHRIHHSPQADQHTSNYGNLLVVWDRLFGTWYAGDDLNQAVGLPDNPYNRKGIVVEYLHTVARSARALRTSLRTGRWRTGPGTVKSG